MVETADAMTAPKAWDEAPLPKRNGTKRILSRQGEGASVERSM